MAISAGNKQVELILKGYNAKQSCCLLPIDSSVLLYAKSYGQLNKGYYSLQDIILSISPEKYGGIFEKDAYRTAELLLEAGAIITKDMPIVAYAAALKDLNLVELYLNHGANPSIVNEVGETGLMIAVLNRDIPIIDLMLNDGRVDINRTSIRLAKDEDEKDTPLNTLDRALISEFWDSSIKADFEIARLLIKHGAVIGQASLEWYAPDELKELKKYQDVIQNSRYLLVKNPYRGLSAGDQPDSKIQEKDSQKHNREVIDLSPDSVFLKKLLSTFEQDQDSEVARMLKGMKEKQDSQETVPIYDVSNKTPIAAKPKLTVGYVFSELFGIQSAQAAHPIAIGTGKALMYGSGMLLGAIAGNKAVEDYKNYQLFSNYSRDYTPYSPEGSYIPALTGNLMLSGANAGLFANPIDQMRFDGTIPEVDTQTARNNIVVNKGRTMPVMDTETSDLLRNIDANLDRPNITDFSTHYRPRSILFTPDSRDSLAELSRLPGFSPNMLDTWQESFPDDRSTLNDFGKLGGFTPDTWKILQEAFPVHEQSWKDSVLYKSNPEFDEYITNIQPGDKVDYTKIYYKDAPYHHQNSTGIIKSKAPSNPISALQNTFKIKDTSKRLIGVDTENKEIIIFDCTIGNEYHGHIVKWEKLGEKERNILVKNNLANIKKGIK